MSITLATLLLQAASTPAAPPVEPPAAQEDPTAAATGRLGPAQAAGGDIVVTARRRTESVQTVPLAVSVIGGTALFRLVQSESARDVFERLGKAGIFVRRFPDRPQWLRFGLPGPEQALARLKQALG